MIILIKKGHVYGQIHKNILIPPIWRSLQNQGSHVKFYWYTNWWCRFRYFCFLYNVLCGVKIYYYLFVFFPFSLFLFLFSFYLYFHLDLWPIINWIISNDFHLFNFIECFVHLYLFISIVWNEGSGVLFDNSILQFSQWVVDIEFRIISLFGLKMFSIVIQWDSIQRSKNRSFKLRTLTSISRLKPV